jgi:hypothetical protein
VPSPRRIEGTQSKTSKAATKVEREEVGLVPSPEFVAIQ